MRNTLSIIILSVTLAASCAGGRASQTKATAAAAVVTPKYYTYIVRNTYPHSTDSYTQGLQIIDGELWESTGEHGASRLMRVELTSGKRKVIASLPESEFGEGITSLGDSIFYLTWQSNKAHLYSRKSGTEVGSFRYSGEGWGLTTDGQKLYMSSGSEYIHTLDPATFRREKSTLVTLKGEPLRYLNELEWIDGKIWANVYTTDQIVVIDPASGVVEGVIDLTGLLPDADRTPSTDVLNGIAHDPATGRTFVTGKNWNKLFEIEIIER